MIGRTRCLLLFVLGVVLVRLASGDILLRYVRPATRPVELVAGAAVALLAGAAWALDRRPAAGEGDLGHRPAGLGAAWFVLAPVLAIVVVTPPALGVSAAAAHAPAVPRRPADPLPALPRGEPVTLPLAELAVRTYWDGGRSLRGHTLQVLGFVTARTVHGVLITRFAITCCAADAEPDDAEIATSATGLQPGEWVRVTGRFAGPSSVRRFAPVLVARAVQPVAAPSNPYD